MKYPARWIGLVVAVVLVLFAVVLATQVGTDPRADSKRSQLTGRTVPEFEVVTLTGDRVSDASLAGKSVIVNFWNTWCIPCREEHPALTEFYARHADDDSFVMLGVVRDDTEAAARRWVRTRGDRWTVAIDPRGRASVAFATRGQPETYAISPDGLVVGYQFGPSTVAGLEQLLRAANGGRT